MQLPKDLLNLVFLEFEDGRDMLNFSEISRRCNQIFHQQIKIIYCSNSDTHVKYRSFTNNKCQLHGIDRVFHGSQMTHDLHYLHGQKHGCQRGWYNEGQLWYERHFYHGKLRGMERIWGVDGSLLHLKHY